MTFNADGTATLDTDLGTLTIDRDGNYVFAPDDDASGGGGTTQSLGSESVTADGTAMEAAWSGVTLSAFGFEGSAWATACRATSMTCRAMMATLP